MHKKVLAVIIPLLVVAMTVGFFISPKLEYSERENRYLETAPIFTWDNLVSGKFTEGISDYLSDHFPLRDSFISINTVRSRLQGKTEINGVYFCEDGYLIEKYEPFKTESIAKVINKFCEKVSAKVIFVPVPTASVIYTDKMPEGSSGEKQGQDMDALLKELKCEALDLRKALLAEKSAQLYYKLDHHWTIDGAYIGYREIMKTLGLTPRLDVEFSFLRATDSFKGTIFNKVGECGLEADEIDYPDLSGLSLEVEGIEGLTDSLYDFSKLDTADKYAFFLSGNHALVKITNMDNAEGKDLLIVKDSYANCLASFLTGDFRTITLIDPRYYAGEISTYVSENNIETVLFLYNMNTMGNDAGIRKVK